MKVYTEINYTWDDEKNELVKESEKSFDYTGEVDQCISIGGYTWKPPWKPPDIDLDPRTSDIKIPHIKPPEIPIPNIPTPGGSFEDLPGGMSLLTENVGYVADEVLGGAGKLMHSALDRAAKAGKEAISGQGGYADDAGPDAPGPGETGYEDATGTLLTKGRKRELTFGREFHAGAGSASTV